FQVPGTITKLETKAHGSWRIQIDTQENMDSMSIEKLARLKDQLGWFTIVKREEDGEIKPDDLLDLPELSEYEDTKKTSSERLRNVLYVFYTKKGGKKENFEQWRLKWMEKKIDEVKADIPQD
ncbi:hypothetical protein LCGC14_2538150, partial [marine sediment metagenome]